LNARRNSIQLGLFEVSITSIVPAREDVDENPCGTSLNARRNSIQLGTFLRKVQVSLIGVLCRIR
ncbi:MAG: hypothetical protein ABIH08_07610, partial [Candidatus Omnitrophota bacterium]